MKLKTEIDKALDENEIVIRFSELTDEVILLQKQISSIINSHGTIAVTKDETDYFLKYQDIIFLETNENRVAIHTVDEIFFTKKKLYELEEEIPFYFLRISKSSIVNTRKIRSIRKNITGASEIEFENSNKKTYVSRNYYKLLMDKMTK